MPIRYDRFLGMIPKLHPTQLPPGAGEIVHNFTPQSGALVPFSADGPFVSMHNDDGTLVAGIPSDEIPIIPKPTAPSVNAWQFYCRPGTGEGNWLGVTMVTFVSYLDAGGARVTSVSHALPVTGRYELAEWGMNMYGTVGYMAPITFANGGPYYFRGPRFMFNFRKKPGLYGGPESNINIPQYLLPSSPVFSSNTVPLVGLDGNVYGEFQVIDYSGPIFDEDILVTDYSYYTYYFPQFSCSFRVSLNYTRPNRVFYHYITSNVDRDDREGPPSELSQRLLVRPGQYLKLNTPHDSGYSVRLYRSSTGNDDFLLVDEGEFSTYYDYPNPFKSDEVQPFGNWCQAIEDTRTSATDAEQTQFLSGSVIHPANFGVAYWEKTLWKSDRYRLHAWPEENTQPFLEDITAIALAGDTVLVFTATKVYGVSGGDPEHASSYLISNTQPLLNTAGLCQIGNTVFWPTYDGLAACSGGQVQIVTEPYFTRDEWTALDPATMGAKTADGCIFLEASFTPGSPPVDPRYLARVLTTMPYWLGTDAPTDGIKIRFDLKAPEAAVTTFTAYERGQGTWKSRVEEYPYDVTFDYVRISAGGPTNIIAWVDGTAQEAVVADDDTPVAVTWPHGRQWQFELRGEYPITSFEAFDRVVRGGEDTLVWTPQDSPGVRNLRFSFPEPSAVAAIVVSAQTTDPIAVTLYGGKSEAIVWQGTITDDRMLQIPIEYRAKHTAFRLEVDTDVATDQVIVAREVKADAGEFIQETFVGLIAPWTVRRYTVQEPTQVRAVRVHATEAVTMRLYYDDASTASVEVSIEDSWEHRIVSDLTFRTLRVAFVDADGNPADDAVESFVLGTYVPTELTGDGAHFSGAPLYRGQLFRFPERSMYSAFSVVADSYPLYLDIYRHKQTQPDHTVTITGPHTHALPWDGIAQANLWEFDLRTDKDGALATRIHAYHLYPKRGVPVNGTRIDVQNPGGAAPWLVARYEASESMYWPSMRVETADGADVWCALWLDGVLQDDLIQCVSGEERYLTDFSNPLSGKLIEFRFYTSEGGRKQRAADDNVVAVHLYGADPQPAGNAVVVADYPYMWREVQFPHRGRFTACQMVMREEYAGTDIKVTLRADGKEIAVTPPHDQVFVLPETTESAQWTIGLEVAGEPDTDGNQIVGVNKLVKSLVLYPEQTAQVDSINASAVPGPPEWVRTRYQFREPTEVVVFVETDAPVTLTGFLDGAAAPGVNITATGWYVTGWDAASVLTLRFTDGADDPVGMDHVVRNVRVLPVQDVAVGSDGVVVLEGLPSYRNIRIRFPQTGAWAGISVDADAETTVTITSGAYVATATATASNPALQRVKSTEETDDGVIVSPHYGAIWILDAVSTGKIHSITLLAWQDVPAQGIIDIPADSGLPDWYRNRYSWPETQVVRSLRLMESDTVTLYLDGAKKAITPTPNVEYRIDDLYQGTELVVAFGTTRTAGALVATDVHVPLESNGFAIRETGVPIHRNRVLRFNEPGTPSVVRARNAASVRLRKYNSGSWTTVNLSEPGYTAVIDSSLSAAIAWEFDVQEYSGELFDLFVFTQVPSALRDGIAVIKAESDPFTWYDRRVIAPRPVSFNSMRVVATGSVTVTAYTADRNTVIWRKTHTGNGVSIRVPRKAPYREVSLDIVPASTSTEIHEFAVSTNMDAMRNV